MTSNVDQWLEALERIRAARRRPPGPGPRPGRRRSQYVETQRAVLLAWKAAVADAVAKGWTREETIARVRFDDAFGPVDVGQGYMMDHIQNNNAGSLWDKLTALGLREGPLTSRPLGAGLPTLLPGRRQVRQRLAVRQHVGLERRVGGRHVALLEPELLEDDVARPGRSPVAL